jgi:hypothetical protein
MAEKNGQIEFMREQEVDAYKKFDLKKLEEKSY